MIQFTRVTSRSGHPLPLGRTAVRSWTRSSGRLRWGRSCCEERSSCHGREVLADPLVGKVFYNLMDNAVRYWQQESHYPVLPAGTGTGTRILVCEDDGEGVPGRRRRSGSSNGGREEHRLGWPYPGRSWISPEITIRETGTPATGAPVRDDGSSRELPVEEPPVKKARISGRQRFLPRCG